MDLKKNKYIIVEIIPTASTPERGIIIQISALKIEGLNLLDRFDYRLNEKKINIPDFCDIISYDKEMFTYKNSSNDIIKEFSSWIEDLPLLILDNQYTEKYLDIIPNPKYYILDYLNMGYQDQIIDKIIQKYELEPSNHIVDLLYEALIKEL